MDKTALQTVKERLQQKINGCIELDMHLEKWAFIQALKFVDEAIPEERQQIEEAFKAGHYNGQGYGRVINATSEDYYQSKYTESKGE